MKEFWVYTALRGLLFVATLALVVGVWLLVADEVPVLWAIVLAFALSGLGSFFVLRRSREAFARKVQAARRPYVGGVRGAPLPRGHRLAAAVSRGRAARSGAGCAPRPGR